MPIVVGYLAAIISMLGWGSYLVPMKRVGKYDAVYYHTVMCVSIFISGSVFSLITQNLTFSWLGLLSGFFWALGNLLSVYAIKYSRLSIAVPIWMAGAIMVSFLWGLVFFRESVSSMLLAILGVTLLAVGVIWVSRIDNQKGSLSRKGIVLASFAGVLFGSYIVPFKLANTEPLLFLFPMCFGILIGGSIPFFINKPKVEGKIILPGAISGILWNVANVASFFSVAILGIAIGFPLTQMALFVSVLWGLLYFHEIKGQSNVIKIIIGSFVLFTGAILLSLSK